MYRLSQLRNDLYDVAIGRSGMLTLETSTALLLAGTAVSFIVARDHPIIPTLFSISYGISRLTNMMAQYIDQIE